MTNASQYHLAVGESATIKKVFMTSTTSVIYAGMVSKSVFSLVVTHSVGHQSMAHNLYFPVTQTRIPVKKGELHILSVSPDNIHFQHLC